MRSSVYDFVEENGRTYHRYKEGSELVHIAGPELPLAKLFELQAM